MTVNAEILPPGTGGDARPLWLVPESRLEEWLREQPASAASWVHANRFQGERYRVLPLPGPQGDIAGAVVGLGPLANLDELTLWHASGLPERLPAGRWRVATPLDAHAATQLLLGWHHGSYRLDRYRSASREQRASLVLPDGADVRYAQAAAEASALARDLINTPANDLGPVELEQAARELAAACGARCEVIEGEALHRGFPLIHAVGAASARPPRLVDLRGGAASGLRVTIVGKGVCFDSGGLDIKPSAGMLLMKKDMGGAACALALAQMLGALETPAQWRVLIPAVENAIGGRAYRPGDVWRSRKGLTVEIGNTDAEGRLVLADALAYAGSEPVDLLIDLATLTGAARVALGPELPAAYSNRDGLLDELAAHAGREHDPIWPMPLWSGYEDELGSKIADLGNVAPGPYAGSIFGALFLQRFVEPATPWLHLDIYAWNGKERPGRPVGAEPQTVRALYRLIHARCA
jgi:leucyl aminopeptidase